MDPANRIGEFESPIRFGKSNCRIAKANSNRQIDLADRFGKSNLLMDLANRIAKSPNGFLLIMDLANRFGIRATHQLVANQICNSNWFVDSFHLAINQRDRFPQD
jgi:hypothetical protein